MGLRMASIVLIMFTLVIAGCSAIGERETGTLRCVGACELIIDRSESTVTVEPDGTETTTEMADGMGG